MGHDIASKQCVLNLEEKIVNGDLEYLKKILTTINNEKGRVSKILDQGVTKQELTFWREYQKSLNAAMETLHMVWDHFHSA